MSITLLTDLQTLRELEQKAQDAPDWPSPVEEVVYTDALLQHAPAMLEVLGCFQEGDVERLRKGDYSVVQRMIYAAGLMEQER